jgi:hypothetical protein
MRTRKNIEAYPEIRLETQEVTQNVRVVSKRLGIRIIYLMNTILDRCFYTTTECMELELHASYMSILSPCRNKISVGKYEVKK